MEIDKKIDKAGYINDLRAFKSYIEKSYQKDPRILLEKISKKPGMKIYCAGMGGSGIASDLLGIYLKKELEIITVKDYDFPFKLKEEDLVIISSYSGNTEEAISCFRAARRANAQILIIASGGKLIDQAKNTNTPYLDMPKNFQPRSTIPFSFFPLLRVFEELALVSSKEEEVKALIDYFERNTVESIAESMSEKFSEKTPIVYSSSKYYPVALRWKTQFNENAKIPAFANFFPELNHNELNSFFKDADKYHVVMLIFDDDIARMKKRMNTTKDVLLNQGVSVTALDIKGDFLTKIFSSVILGDFISYFTALRLGVDPSPVVVIEDFKRRMGPFI
ncbi:MAG: bifunctional phosphoglucose/phosphomannose isomerase [Candidatus Woesearchaeota archaeon]